MVLMALSLSGESKLVIIAFLYSTAQCLDYLGYKLQRSPALGPLQPQTDRTINFELVAEKISQFFPTKISNLQLVSAPAPQGGQGGDFSHRSVGARGRFFGAGNEPTTCPARVPGYPYSLWIQDTQGIQIAS